MRLGVWSKAKTDPENRCLEKHMPPSGAKTGPAFTGPVLVASYRRYGWAWTPRPAGSLMRRLKSSTSFAGAQMASVIPPNRPYQP